MPHIIANQIDKLCNVEFHPGSGHCRGYGDALYAAAREAQGNEPLTYLAAKRLMETVKRGTRFLLLPERGLISGFRKARAMAPSAVQHSRGHWCALLTQRWLPPAKKRWQRLCAPR